jgi:hypothetical protein
LLLLLLLLLGDVLLNDGSLGNGGGLALFFVV